MEKECGISVDKTQNGLFPPPRERFPFLIGQPIFGYPPGFPHDTIVSKITAHEDCIFLYVESTKAPHLALSTLELCSLAPATSQEDSNRIIEWLSIFRCWTGYCFSDAGALYAPKNVLAHIAERPDAPIFSTQSICPITKWYFGVIPYAPVLEENRSYDKYEISKLDGKAFWVKDLEMNIAFPVCYNRRWDRAIHISIHDPFGWNRMWYGKEWLAYGQKPDGCLTWDEVLAMENVE